MKARVWKLLMLVGGAIGVVAFFLTLAKGRALDGSMSSSITAFEIATNALHTHGRYQDITGARELATIAYIPAFGLLVIGALGTLLGRLPRTVGGIAMLLGVASVVFWGVLLEATFDRNTVALGIGAHLLFVAGLAGIAGGVATVSAPGGPSMEPHSHSGVRTAGGKPRPSQSVSAKDDSERA